MKKKILISGITGQDGYNMAHYIIQNYPNEYNIYGSYRNKNKIDLNDELFNKINLVNIDISDHNSIDIAFQTIIPDYFINFASDQPQFEKNDLFMFQTNTNSTVFILQCILKYNKNCRYFSAGSSLEFGKKQGETIVDINDSCSPHTMYGISKLTNRYITDYYRKEYNLFVVHAILFNHDSSRRTDAFILKKIINHLKHIKNDISDSNQCITIENINARKDWSDSNDFIEAIWLMLNKDTSMNYILSSGNKNSLIDFIEIACKYLDIDVQWMSKNNDLCLVHNNKIILIGNKGNSDVIIGNNKDTLETLNWKPKISFDKMIFNMITR